MSRDLLARLREGHAFNPTPTDDLVAVYVPFDELRGEQRTEASLERAALAGERIALVGPSGSGKSSLAAYALGADPRFALIRVPVDGEGRETVGDPLAFARHLLSTLSIEAARVQALPAERREQIAVEAERVLAPASRETTGRASVGVNLPFLAVGDLAYEVSETVGEQAPQTVQATFDVVDATVRLITAHGLIPVLLVDDSDRWLNRPGGDDKAPLVQAFFGEVLRALAERGLALVVAVHLAYMDMVDFGALTAGFLETRIHLPELARAEELQAILRRRVEFVDSGEGLDQVFGEGALDTLFDLYRTAASKSVRRTLEVAQGALINATGQGREVIGRALVEAAGVEILPPVPGDEAPDAAEP